MLESSDFMSAKGLVEAHQKRQKRQSLCHPRRSTPTTWNPDNCNCCFDHYAKRARSVFLMSLSCVAHHRGQHRNGHAQLGYDSSQGRARSNPFGVQVPRETRGCDKKRPRDPHSHGAGVVPRELCTAIERFHPLANRIPCAHGTWHGTHPHASFGQRKNKNTQG